MLKLVSKFAMDIFPSVIATIIGAYIVNHYINNKSPADTSVTAAAVSSTDPKKAPSRSDTKPVEKSADLTNIPEPGVRAKGISEKSVFDKAGVDRVGAEKSAEKPAEKSPEKPAEKADKPSEAAGLPPSAPAEGRRHQSSPREKAISRAAPAPVPAPASPAPPAEPVVAAAPAPPTENAPDANDLARAAIERLRGASDASHSQEAPRAAEPPRVMAAPAAPQAPAVTPPLQPLPPPILVSTPPDAKAPYPPAGRTDDPLRPTPPADIPDPRPPLDLRADAVDAAPAKRPSVADDVLSAAKSVFQSVLPK